MIEIPFYILTLTLVFCGSLGYCLGRVNRG